MSDPTDELSILREHLERYRSVTLQTLDLVPNDKLGWFPAEAQFSFAQQFLHIALTEEFYARGLLAGAWDASRLDLPQGGVIREDLRQKLGEVRRYTLSELEKLDAGRLDSIVSVPNIPVEWPLRSWLWYLVEHEIHHKAQLATYLRQIGLTPPFFAFALPPGVRPDIK